MNILYFTFQLFWQKYSEIPAHRDHWMRVCVIVVNNPNMLCKKVKFKMFVNKKVNKNTIFMSCSYPVLEAALTCKKFKMLFCDTDGGRSCLFVSKQILNVTLDQERCVSASCLQVLPVRSDPQPDPGPVRAPPPPGL